MVDYEVAPRLGVGQRRQLEGNPNHAVIARRAFDDWLGDTDLRDRRGVMCSAKDRGGSSCDGAHEAPAESKPNKPAAIDDDRFVHKLLLFGVCGEAEDDSDAARPLLEGAPIRLAQEVERLFQGAQAPTLSAHVLRQFDADGLDYVAQGSCPHAEQAFRYSS